MGVISDIMTWSKEMIRLNDTIEDLENTLDKSIQIQDRLKEGYIRLEQSVEKSENEIKEYKRKVDDLSAIVNQMIGAQNYHMATAKRSLAVSESFTQEQDQEPRFLETQAESNQDFKDVDGQ